MARRPVLFLVALFLCLLGTAVAAAFAPTFSGSSDTRLVGGVLLGGDGYQLTSDHGGAATVLWTQQKLVDGASGQETLRVRQQNPSGRWGPVTQIGGIGEPNNIVLVEDPSGAAAVVWTGDQSSVEVATRRSAEAPWSAPQAISLGGSNTGPSSGQLAAAIDAAGVVTIAWTPDSTSDSTLFSATVDASNGVRTPAVPVASADFNAAAPVSLAENADGEAVLSWQAQESPAPTIRSHSSVEYAEEVAVRTPAGVWGLPRQLGQYSVGDDLGVGSEAWAPNSSTATVTADGTVAVGWRSGGPAGAARLELATRNPVTGTWMTGRILSTDVGGFTLAAGPRNGLIAAWSDSARDDRVYVASRLHGGRWSAARSLASVRGGTEGPYLAAAPDGRIALTPETGNDRSVEFAARSTRGRWSGLKKASTGQLSEITFGAHNSLTIVWETFGHRGDRSSDSLHSKTVRI